MNAEEFNIVVNQRCEKLRNVLTKKAGEYAKDNNRFHNFERAAQISGETREKALWGMALKHVVSFLDIIDDIDNDILPSRELLDEKMGDFMAYLLLEEGCIIDRINKQDAEKQN